MNPMRLRLWSIGLSLAAYFLFAIAQYVLPEWKSAPAGVNAVRPWLYGLAGLLLLGAVFAQAWRAELVRAKRHLPEPADERIKRLVASLRESAVVASELQAEIELRTTALERLAQETEDTRNLAAIHEKEAKAVSRLVETTIAAANSQSNRRASRVQWGFFLAGIAFAVPLGAIGQAFYEWIN